MALEKAAVSVVGWALATQVPATCLPTNLVRKTIGSAQVPPSFLEKKKKKTVEITRPPVVGGRSNIGFWPATCAGACSQRPLGYSVCTPYPKKEKEKKKTEKKCQGWAEKGPRAGYGPLFPAWPANTSERGPARQPMAFGYPC